MSALARPAGDAELAARVTMARAILGDFGREGLDALTAGPEPDWATWAHRLGAALRGLLAALDTPQSTGADAGKLDAIRGVLGDYDRNCTGGPTALERIEQIAGVGRTIVLADLGTVLGALDDAAAYREHRGGAECSHCDAHPAGLCEDHGEDMARAAGYRELARELGIEVAQ